MKMLDVTLACELAIIVVCKLEYKDKIDVENFHSNKLFIYLRFSTFYVGIVRITLLNC